MAFVAEKCDPFSETRRDRTKYEYEVTNLLTKIIDSGSNQTVIEYDMLGRRAYLNDPDAGEYDYEYDSNGNLDFLTDPEERIIDWDYDAVDRPTSRVVDGVEDVTWQYDTRTNGEGLLAKRIDDASTYNPLAYDLLGRVTSEHYLAGNKYHVIETSYDPLGQLVKRTYPGGLEVDWIRGNQGFLTAIETSGAQPQYASNIQWDAQGRLESWTDGNGLTSTTTFDSATGRLDEMVIGVHEHLRYGFDDGDRVQTIDDLIHPSSNRSFDYDGLNRLTLSTGPYRSGSSDTLRYKYDDYGLGNLICLGASDLGNCQADGTEFTYPSPGLNAVRPHAPTHINGQSVTHDDSGNFTVRGSRTYTYDALGALRSVANSGTSLTMTYDADGRLGKLVEDGETRHIITEDFEWLQTRQLSRIQIRLAGNVIASDEATYNPTEGPSCAVLAPALDAGWGAPLGLLFPGLCAFLVLQVGFALRRRPQGDRLRPVLAAGTAGVFLAATSVPFPGVVAEAHAADPTGVTYYHSDHLGSSVVITNGMTVKRVVYRPFGQAASGSDPVPEFGFTGQRFVDSLEIYDYGARWYDPALGRFLQPDPIVRGPSHVPNTSDPQTINPYSYVLNNPLNLVDPTGNTPLGYSSLNYSSSTYSYPSYGSSSFSYSYPSYYTEEQARFYGYLNAGSSSYFSSAPSLSTFASSLSSQSGVSAASPASGGGFWSGVGGVLGNTWNLPNTIVGTAWGLAGMAVGGTASVAWGALHVASFGRLGGFSWFGGGISLGNNAIQFTNSPLHFSGVATTVGNAIIYGGGQATPGSYGAHEAAHTIQGQWLGPLYLPAHILTRAGGVIAAPFNSSTIGSAIAGDLNNPLEVGPYSNPPRPWP